MKTDIILAGVGGQGILSIAAAIGHAAVNENLYIKQSEVHGMSQRGGDVQSHLRLSDQPIWSDLIPKGKGDLILSVEPMEALRYLPYLAKAGWLVTNSTPFNNISNYPDIMEVLERIKAVSNHILVDADAIAKELGSSRASNIVMLGAATPFIDLPFSSIVMGIHQLFARKGAEVVESNVKALKAGRDFTERNR